MKALVVEDDFTSRLIVQEILRAHGDIHFAADGKEALEAVALSLDEDDPYDLICMDIMMPEMDGQEALEQIRALEKKRGLSLERQPKVVMITALGDMKNVIKSYNNLCDGYLTKPIHKADLLNLLNEFGLVV